MLFNSLEYLIFLPTVLALYLWLGHRAQNRMLLAASYLFYGWWDVRFLYLIVLSTVVDYCAGLMIERGGVDRRDRWRTTAYVLVCAAVLVGIDWSAFAWRDGGPTVDRALLHANLFGIGGATVLGTLVVVAVAHLLYPRLRALPDARRRRVFATLSILTNLGLLGFFKYFDFFVESAEALFASLGIHADMRLHVVLPVGISFYTFQTMSYTIDVYRGRCRSTDDFLDFALFVSFFPQLVAGPIERASHLLPQILARRSVRFDQLTRGLFLILFGLFKKVAIADGIAGSVDSVFSSGFAAGAADVSMATLLFALQIYCDFSGYSDIARGTSKLLGIDLMRNFDLPYFSADPSEFWRRWHISLSTWLRDYLYIPLGGNRHGRARTYRNLMLTMGLGGLWHGAAWNFVVWGLYHGAVLCIYRALGWQDIARGSGVGRRLLRAGAIVFCSWGLVLYSWMLFRAESLTQIVDYTHTLLTGWGDLALTLRRPTSSALAGIALFVVVEAIEYATGRVRYYLAWPKPVRGAFYAALFLLTLMGTSNEPAQFIYFQF